VLCSRRGISLRKGGPRKLVPRKLVLPLSNHVLRSLREAARSLGKDSTERLVSDLLEKIVSDDLYKAVLDEEATPDRPVTPAPQNDPTPPPEQIDPAGFVHSTPPRSSRGVLPVQRLQAWLKELGSSKPRSQAILEIGIVSSSR